jgi:tetratricopeptide (TPR) repeat protein
MTRHHLAIPGGSFLLISLVFPAVAQTPRENPPAPQSTSATAEGGAQKLSDEELGRLYLVRKQYREAQEVFRKLTIEHPKNAVYWNELGISLHNQMDLASALKCYEKSAKLDPKYPDPQNNIGTIQYERKKYTKAIRSYKRAIAVRDDFAPFYLNLGYAYFGQKKYEDSIGAFRKALELDPFAFDPTKAHSGTVVQDRSIASDRAHFYFLLAKSFAQSGDVERCALYLKKAKDEGYQDMNSVNSDAAFARVVKNPSIQEILSAKPPDTTQQ